MRRRGGREAGPAWSAAPTDLRGMTAAQGIDRGRAGQARSVGGAEIGRGWLSAPSPPLPLCGGADLQYGARPT